MNLCDHLKSIKNFINLVRGCFRRPQRKVSASVLFALAIGFFAVPASLQAADACTGSITHDFAAGDYTETGSFVSYASQNYYFIAPSKGTVTITQTGHSDILFVTSDTTCPDAIEVNGMLTETFIMQANEDFNLKLFSTRNNTIGYDLLVTFTPIKSPPVMSAIPYQFFVTSTPYTLDLSTFMTEVDGDLVTYSVAGGPAWLSLDTSTGVLSGTPDSNGTFTVTATATDIDGSASTDFVLSSTPSGTVPTMGAIADQDIPRDTLFTLDISSYVTLGDSAISLYTMSGTLPAGLDFNTSTGVLSGTPTIDGTYTLTVYATDAENDDSNSVVFDIIVSPPGTESDLLLLKTASTRYSDVNSTVTYVITIANETSSAITDINITDVLTSYLYDIYSFSNGVEISPPFDLNITITDSGSFDCSTVVSNATSFTCTGGSVPKRNGNSGVPGLDRIYYTITTPYDPVPAALYNEVMIDGTITTEDATVIVLAGGTSYPNVSTPPPNHADVINGDLWDPANEAGSIAAYNAGSLKVIKTKKSGDTVVITGVHLDGDAQAVPFTPVDPAQSFVIYPYISDGLCASPEWLLDPDGKPVMLFVTNGETVASSEAVMPKNATRNARIYVTYQDFDQLSIDSGETCYANSSTIGNLAGLGQCVNSDNKYYDVFGLSAYERCQVANGSPCLSANGGYSCGGDQNDPNCDYNPLYDNEFGCMMCTLNIYPDCSSDNFAIRPERFEINGTATTHYPDLMRSGKEYDLTINAYDYNSMDNTALYDQYGSNISEDNITKFYANGGVEVAGALMAGTGDLSNTFVFSNGVTTTPAVFSYSDVGDISIHLEDRDWALVDINNINDTTPEDCSDEGAYICGDLNVTFIPDHFRVNVDLNNSSNSFTYLSNEQNMTAHLYVTVYAENEDNVTVQNFTQPAFGHTYYENPLTVLMKVPDHPILGVADKNETTTPTLFGFDLGVKVMSWNDANSTLALWFNYVRQTNLPVNPFILYGKNVIVDINSTYPATGVAVAPEGNAYIDGTGKDDANITYVYGRTHMARTRAMCNGSPCSGNVTFFYEFYGDKGAADYNQTLITNLLGTSPKRSLDSVNWYRNTLHNTATDGNVTYSTQNIPGDTIKTAAGFTHSTQTTSASYAYDGSKGYPYKGTIHVPSSLTNGTQSWLIYDKYAPDPAPEISGELEYYGPGSWSSDTGPEGSVTDTSGNKNRNTNRRIRW